MMALENTAPWWPKYQLRMRFLDGGRVGDLVDCYGMVAQIYKAELDLKVPDHPHWTLGAATTADISFLNSEFTSGFRPVERGFEQPFDVAVIRRPLPVNGKLKRGWWHVGLISRAGFILHIDYHQGVVEVPFRDTGLALQSPMLRTEDVRLFRHGSLGADSQRCAA
jgi:hypothetical protein